MTCNRVRCATQSRYNVAIGVAIGAAFSHAAHLEPCPRCGTYLLRRTTTGQTYCPLCEQP